DRPGLAPFLLVHGADPLRRRQAALDACAGLAFLLTTPPADDAGWEVLVRQATVAGCGVVLDVPDGLDARTRRWVERAAHLSFALCSTHPLELATVPDLPYAEVEAADPAVTDA